MLNRLLAFLLAFFAAIAPAMADDARDPISKTPLSQVGISLQSGIVSPTAGLATSLSDISRGPNYAKALNNLQMIKRGVWTSRGIGWAKERAGVFNSAATFLDFGTYVSGAGVETILFQVGNTLYSYNLSTSTETSIGSMTTLSASALPCMRNSVSVTGGAPMTVYCNGNIEPRKITSTSASSALLFNTPGVWPGTFNAKTYSKPTFCEPLGDRMAYSGFTGDPVAFDVLISNQGDPEKFSISTPVVATDAVGFTVPPILGPIRGIRSFKISNETNDEVLLIGCGHGMAVITGNTASTYAMRILTRAHGLLSNRCWVQINNNLYYLASDGIRSYSSLVSNANLLNESLTYLIQDKINAIDTTSVTKAHATHNTKTQEVQWWVPMVGDTGQCKHALILNYNNDLSNSNELVPAWSTKDGFAPSSSAVFGGQFYHGTYDGFLCKDYTGDTYGGTPIVFDYVTPLISLGNPSQMASSRKAVVICDGQRQQFDIKPYVYSRLGSGETKRATGSPVTQKLTGGITGATALGLWALSSSPFPTDHIRTLDFQAVGNGLFWEYELSASSNDDTIDLAGIQYILSGGGMQR